MQTIYLTNKHYLIFFFIRLNALLCCMKNSNNVQSGGTGFLSLLLVLFIGLKLTNYIDWSWWWVMAPFWIPAGIVAMCLVIVGLAYLIKESK